ncbi:MAG: YfhO family protein [Chloroflexia bacterium]
MTTTLKESALLPLPVLMLLGLLWLAGLALARWRPLRSRWPELPGEWGMVGALAALNIAFFWRVLLTRDTWLPRGGGDFNSFYYPLYSFAARSIGAGDFPLWNPHLYGGMPFAADQQTGIFSPINLLAFLLANPFGYGTLELLAIGHVFLASLTAYALCRDLGARRAAALIGGVTFAYSGFIVSHLGHYPMVAVAAWLPAAFLTMRRALLRRSLGWTIAAAIALLLALLGGHQQIFLYLLTALGLYWLYLTWAESPEATWPRGLAGLTRWLNGTFAGHWLGSLGRIMLAGAVAACLAAPMLLPSLQLAGRSIRSGISYSESTAFSMRPLHLITLLIPNAFGTTPETYIGAVGFSGEVWGYAGVIALLLAVFAFWRTVGCARRDAIFFGGLGLLALVVALGAATPLQGWFYAFVPGYSRIRASGRWLLLFDFSVAALAALGTENLLRLLTQEFAATIALLRRVGRWLAIGLGVVALLLFFLYGNLLAPADPSAPLAQFLDGATWTLVLAGLAAGLALLVVRGHLRAILIPPALVALVVFDLFAATAPVPPTNTDPLAGFRHDATLAIIRAGAGQSFFRIDPTRLSATWQPSWAAVAGLESVVGTYNPLGLANYNRFWDETFRRHDSPRYDLLNIRYVMLPPNESPAGEGKFREVQRGEDFVVYENLTPLPRAFLVGNSRTYASDEDAWTAVIAPTFDPRTTAYLTMPADSDDAPPAISNGTPQGTVNLARPTPDELIATVETDREAILVLSEVAYPGWRATVDGQATPVYTTDYTFRGVRVPPGRHTVRIAFEPPLWRLGWLISGITAGALGLLGIVHLLRRRQQRPLAPAPTI